MFVINYGMPKSGTTLLRSYQLKMLEKAYPDNGINELRKYANGTYINFIDDKIAKLLRKIHDDFGPFVVKTHCEPSRAIRELIENGIAKATISFRDPRDTVLSILDHSERTRNGNDNSGAFQNVYVLTDAVNLVLGDLKRYKKWRNFGKGCFIRYEELMKDKISCLRTMNNYFGFALSESILAEMFNLYEREKHKSWNFNKGETERWRSEMSAEEKNFCQTVFRKDLDKMGYKCADI